MSQREPVQFVDLTTMTDAMEHPELVRSYPFKVRLRHLETVDSYQHRLLTANFESTLDLDRLVRIAQKQWRISPRVLRTAIVAAKGGLSATAFEDVNAPELRHRDGSSCISCRVGTGDQWMCRLCSRGEAIALRSHLEKVVCTRHKLWVGSGATPEKQFHADDTFIAAEKQFQRLRQKGVVDANTLWELLHVVNPELADEAEHRLLPAEPFPVAIRLWTLLASRQFAARFFDPNRTYAESFQYLQQQIAAKSLGERNLAVRVWHYLRPTALTIREAVRDERPFQPHWEHDFWVDPAIVISFAAPIRPLEPFSRYLEASDSSLITSENWREVLTHRSAGHGITFIRAEGSDRRPGICAAGHRVSVKPVHSVGLKTSHFCSFCDGRIAIPGETDIVTTHPLRARDFDGSANAPLTASQLVAGSLKIVAWICPLGHQYRRSVKSQLDMQNPCPVCDNLVALRGFNSLEDTHPRIADEWDRLLNKLNPWEVTARANGKAWFICPKCGRPYETLVRSRILGHGCMACRVHIKPIRLADRVPQLESQWRSSLNAGLAFAEAEGLEAKYTWICGAGHVMSREASWRARFGCGACSGHVKTDSVNGLLEKYPLITSEFDSSMNTSTKFQMNAKERYFWRCSYGHIRKTTLHNRRQSGGCADCVRELRIAFGTDEQSASGRARLVR